MIKTIRSPNNAFEQGIVLIEGMIAILILSVGVLGIVGLQASMIRAATESRYRAEANFVVQQRLGQMWANPENLAGFVIGEPGQDISQATGLPSATLLTTLGDATCNSDPACVLVTVRWQMPGSEDVRSVSNVAYIISE